MNEHENALPSGGSMKSVLKPAIPPENLTRCRLFLLWTFGWCLLVAYAEVWEHGPCAGLTLCILVWYLILFFWKGRTVLQRHPLLFTCNLFRLFQFCGG